MEKQKALNYTIGIDLGSTYSSVAVWQNQKVEVIANDQGHRITPSYVAFTHGSFLLGDAAKDEALIDPTNSIFNVKRLIGRRFSDPILQKNIANLPFQVQCGPDDRPLISVKSQGGTRRFFPEQISSMVLSKMKETAESFLGQPVRDAVITVPTHFTDSQREATRDAGTIAGLNVKRILNKTTAATIAYALEQQENQQKNILFFDLGGGTFNASIVTASEGIYQVKATAGSTHLGGEDFDDKLVEYCISKFTSNKGTDIRKNARALRKLRVECEKAKRILSTSAQSTIQIASLTEGQDFQITISRATFEDLCMEDFKTTIRLVDQALKGADINKYHIQEIVLTGGSSRIPKITQLLKQFFDGVQPNKSLNPDEAAVIGAAAWAGLLSGQKSEKLDSMLMIDVTSYALGLQSQAGTMNHIIARNSTIPNAKTQLFTTHSDQQTKIYFKVYEGQHELAKDNHYLGQFSIQGFAPGEKGSVQIEVSFQYYEDGILHVKCQNPAITITKRGKGRLSKKEVEELAKDPTKNCTYYENIAKQKAEAKDSLNQLCKKAKSDLQSKEFGEKIPKEQLQVLSEKLQEIESWASSNPEANGFEYEWREQDLQRLYSQLQLRAKGTDVKQDINQVE